MASSPGQASAPFSSDCDIASFDVFDTIICRTWFHPRDVFLVLARNMAPGAGNKVHENIAAVRHTAEKRARRSLGKEPGLFEIHREMSSLLKLDASSADANAELELMLERQCARPIGLTSERYFTLSYLGRRVIFLSDTYFTEAQLVSILPDALKSPDRVFTSRDRGGSKRDGRLFKIAEVEFPQKTFCHIGDKPTSDYHNALGAGWRAEVFSGSRPSSFERLLVNHAWSHRLVGSAVAGAARSARLSGTGIKLHEMQLADIGAGAAGPIFTAFVAWSFEEALASGRQKILFLARDGQISSRIADRLSIPVPHDYAYASRQSLYLPAVMAVGDDAWLWLSHKMDKATGLSVLRRFGLDGRDDALEIVSNASIPLDDILGVERARRLADLLRGPLSTMILEIAVEKRKLVCDYFLGLIGGAKRVAVVDVGWKGRLQVCLARIFASDPRLCDIDLSGLYFALAGTSAVKGEYPCRQFMPYRSVASRVLIEVMASADHGTTVGYSRNAAGGVDPCLIESSPDTNETFSDLQTAAVRFAADLIGNLEQARLPKQYVLRELAHAARASLKTLSRHPSADEASCLGDIPHASDQTHSRYDIVAPILSLRDAVLLSAFGINTSGRRKTYWLAGSLARSFPESPMLTKLLLTMSRMRRS